MLRRQFRGTEAKASDVITPPNHFGVCCLEDTDEGGSGGDTSVLSGTPQPLNADVRTFR